MFNITTPMSRQAARNRRRRLEAPATPVRPSPGRYMTRSSRRLRSVRPHDEFSDFLGEEQGGNLDAQSTGEEENARAAGEELGVEDGENMEVDGNEEGLDGLTDQANEPGFEETADAAERERARKWPVTRDIAHQLAHLPQEGMRGGKMNRAWMVRTFLGSFRNNNNRMAIGKKCALFNEGAARLNLSDDFFDWLVNENRRDDGPLTIEQRQRVRCDESFGLHIHEAVDGGASVACCEDHGDDGPFLVCSACVGQQEKHFTGNAAAIWEFGAVTTPCYTCSIAELLRVGPGHNGCVCHSQPRCLSHRQEHLERVAERYDEFVRSHEVASLLGPAVTEDDYIIPYATAGCDCGEPPVPIANPFALKCRGCDQVITLPLPRREGAEDKGDDGDQVAGDGPAPDGRKDGAESAAQTEAGEAADAASKRAAREDREREYDGISGWRSGDKPAPYLARLPDPGYIDVLEDDDGQEEEDDDYHDSNAEGQVKDAEGPTYDAEIGDNLRIFHRRDVVEARPLSQHFPEYDAAFHNDVGQLAAADPQSDYGPDLDPAFLDDLGAQLGSPLPPHPHPTDGDSNNDTLSAPPAAAPEPHDGDRMEVVQTEPLAASEPAAAQPPPADAPPAFGDLSSGAPSASLPPPASAGAQCSGAAGKGKGRRKRGSPGSPASRKTPSQMTPEEFQAGLEEVNEGFGESLSLGKKPGGRRK